MLGQMAWTIIRFELHHLWNPDWTYAFPQSTDEYDYGNFDDVYYEGDDYDDHENGDVNGIVGEHDGLDSGEDEDAIVEPFDEHGEEMLDNFKVKDGGPIPLLEMTYINKTQPKPCDKEAYLYELNESALKLQRPLQGILRNCHESNCEKLKTNLYRQKPRPSVFYHPQEEEISLCGGCSSPAASLGLLLAPLLCLARVSQSSL